MTSNRQNATIDEHNLENVHNFIYVDGNEFDKIKRRIQFTNRAFYMILLIIKASCIHREAKLRAYKTDIKHRP